MSVWNPLEQVASELDRLFSSQPSEGVREGESIPLGINQLGEGLELVAELPGITPDRLGISVDDGVLELRVSEVDKTVSSEGGEDAEERRGARYDGARVRRIQVPEGYDAENIQASLKLGVLMVRLPRVAKPKPKQINVQVQEG